MLSTNHFVQVLAVTVSSAPVAVDVGSATVASAHVIEYIAPLHATQVAVAESSVTAPAVDVARPALVQL